MRFFGRKRGWIRCDWGGKKRRKDKGKKNEKIERYRDESRVWVGFGWIYEEREGRGFWKGLKMGVLKRGIEGWWEKIDVKEFVRGLKGLSDITTSLPLPLSSFLLSFSYNPLFPPFPPSLPLFFLSPLSFFHSPSFLFILPFSPSFFPSLFFPIFINSLSFSITISANQSLS